MFTLYLNKNENLINNELPVRLILTMLPHDEDNKVVTCIDTIGYYEYGRFLDKTKDRRLIDGIRKGLNSLIESETISCIESIKDNYVLDGSTCKCDISKGNFTMIQLEELHKIMETNNLDLLRYFVNLMGTVNADTKAWHMSQNDMCECWDMNFVTIDKYNKILEEMKLIYIHRPNARKKDGTFHKVNNSYGRFIDKDCIIADAMSYLHSTDENYYSSKNTMSGDDRTSIKMKYNGFCKGAKKYANNPKLIEELYGDCIRYNDSLEYNNDNGCNPLDLSVFDDCIDKNTKRYMIDGVVQESTHNIETVTTMCLPLKEETAIDNASSTNTDDDYWNTVKEDIKHDNLIDIDSLFNSEYAKSVNSRYDDDWTNW